MDQNEQDCRDTAPLRSILLLLIKVTNSSRYSVTERSVYANLVEQVLMFANPYHCILHSQYLIQMKLSSTATLGTEKSGHCREVVVVEAETTVNVRAIRLKKMAVVQRWPLWEVRG